MKQTDKKPEKKQNKKRGMHGPGGDDDSVDSYGNLRELIDYDYESEDSEQSDLSLTRSELHRLKKSGKLPERVKDEVRKPRKAAIKARERIRRKLAKENSRRVTPNTESSDSTYESPEEASPKRKGESYEQAYKRLVKKRIEEEPEAEAESESDSTTASAFSEPKKRKGFLPRKKRVESESEEEEDSETLGSEDTDESEEYEDAQEGEFKGFSISFGGGGYGEDDMERMIPRRHNMKKETEEVRKFVKLVTKSQEPQTIDDQIDQFKEMDATKQRCLLEALQVSSDQAKKEQPLMFRLLQMKMSPDTMGMVMKRVNALNQMDSSNGEYHKLQAWMEKVVSLPLGTYKPMPVSLTDGPDLCQPFMEKAKRCLNEAIYGQDDAKLQILQFIASKLANPTASGLSLLLTGPPGIGKTSLIKNGIAKALEWPFQFISLGGDSDATTYTGHQYVYEGSHCGKIANSVIQAKSMSMILMFDELDKISDTPKGEEVQNLLVHLTDPVQNMDFEDKYLSGIPLDLSRSMFVFSGNDLNKINKILLDRMIVVRLNGYETKDKIAIAEQYLLPEALREVNLMEKVAVTREVMQYVLENYAKDETGVRELKRCIAQIVQRINVLRMFNVKDLPFHIPGFQLPFVLKKEHVDLFLKKKDVGDSVPYGMYT